MILTDNQIKEFKSNGLLIIPNFYSETLINEIREELYKIIWLTAAQKKINIRKPDFRPESFDSEFNQLIKIDREIGSIVYDAAKHLLSFHNLLSLEIHSLIMKQLRIDSMPAIASGGYGIRIDNPGEDKFRAYWHQEYPSQLRSLNGLVFWSPLVEITNEIGPVIFCPKSHLLGTCPVIFDEDSDRIGAYKLKLFNETYLISNYEKISPLTKPGDVVIVDYLTLHASGENRSARSRWSMQFRYFDFNDATGRSINWKGSFAAGTDFAKVHPDLIRNSH